MLPEHLKWIGVEFEPEGDPWHLLAIAHDLEEEGNLPAAATVYDRAHGINPGDEEIRQGRARILDQLAVVEHGICFRYIPGGVFLMGTDGGEPDERPRHPVWLSPYWLSEAPISWAAYCRLMGWSPPPEGLPTDRETPEGEFDSARFHLYEANKLRLQYCEDKTTQARDWHAHALGQQWQSGGQIQTAQELFGTPPREEPDAPWRHDTKPMIAVAWQEAQELGDLLSTPRLCYGLPTEAQWEKAARGGLIGARHAWGNEPPTHDRCDFDSFHNFSILPSRTFAPNDYGLYAMTGGVWEWTRDWYDRDFYRHSPDADPAGPPDGEEKVLRGGSWADCADVQTVMFRMSRGSSSWRSADWGDHLAPNLGFRLCRTVVAPERSEPEA
ncbi:MAG: formylglycine-generating enzyme family protein [Gemmataceae bacterium]|nr:formylglycine-generating enzyme family protein [Gemmataceae bacterium]